MYEFKIRLCIISKIYHEYRKFPQKLLALKQLCISIVIFFKYTFESNWNVYFSAKIKFVKNIHDIIFFHYFNFYISIMKHQGITIIINIFLGVI